VAWSVVSDFGWHWISPSFLALAKERLGTGIHVDNGLLNILIFDPHVDNREPYEKIRECSKMPVQS
jgi:hypothetical protein